MDVAVAREVLNNLCQACMLLNIEKEQIPRWQAMISKLPPYQKNKDGAFKEWLSADLPDNYHHRHLSHLYPLFPGFEITRENDPDLFKACRTAVEKRLIIGLSSQTGWSLAHMALIYARLENGERANECLELLIRSCVGSNLFTYHNDWRAQGLTMYWGHHSEPPFQIDANMGFTAAVLEMLVFSAPGWLKLLPAPDKKWKKGNVRGLCARGGLKIDMTWDFDRKIFEATIKSSTDQEVTVKFPAEIRSITCNLPSDHVKDTHEGIAYKRIHFLAGKTVKLKANLDLKSV
jgi:alpha-L-fucosidase 2